MDDFNDTMLSSPDPRWSNPEVPAAAPGTSSSPGNGSTVTTPWDLFQSNPDALSITTLDEGRYVVVNDAFCRLVGHRREDIIGRTVMETKLWVNPKERLALTSRLQQNGSAARVETRFRTKAGEIRWAQLSAEVLSRNGQPLVLCITRDITEQKHDRRALQAMNAALEAAVEGIAFLNVKGRYTHVNQAYAVMLGRTPEEMVGMDWTVTVHPLDLEMARAAYREMVHEGKGEVEVRGVRKDGSQFHKRVAMVRQLDERGHFTGHYCFASDISEHKQAEEQVREAERVCARVFENANDIIFTLDAEGKISSVNRAGEKIIGYTREQVRGMPVADLVAPEYVPAIRNLLKRRHSGDYSEVITEVEAVARGGARVWLEVSTSALLEDGKLVGIQGIARDVTERRSLQAQLLGSQRVEALGRLAGGIAHDFNNILGITMGNSELLLERMHPDDPCRKQAEEIRDASRKAASLTRQLLAFGRKQVLNASVLNLNDVVIDIEKLLRRVIGEDIEFKTNLADDLRNLKADRTQLEQVLLNLVMNSRDAMSHGGTLSIETRNLRVSDITDRSHPPDRVGDYVVLVVTDTGCGMDRETQEHIFEPFFTTKEPGKGTGLGLSTVYGIVKQSNGYIWVYSEPGYGTTFKIYLSACAGDPVRAPLSAAGTRRLHGTETVMVVEDEGALRRLNCLVLQDYGYTTLEARDGQEALAISKNHTGTIDVLVTDMVMPRMSGRDLVKQIVQAYPGVKVVYVSGYTNDMLGQSEILRPGSCFLEKPFSTPTLIAKIRGLLDGTQ